MIPNKFQLAGIEVTVKNDKTLIEKHGTIGQSIYAEQLIKIDPSVTPQDTINQTFYHELVHWILFMMGEDKLKDNEKFVDTFGHFLYQAIKSAEYAEAKCED